MKELTNTQRVKRKILFNMPYALLSFLIIVTAIVFTANSV